ncbi:MAG: hypothetical protein M3003_01795 [Candidatus Dormibacteraeota bacterium]|nr:hypothetical protein [Candidatus Dormibacteraeota bacterium]
MLFRTLHRLGVPSDLAYGAGVVSIAGAIIAWAMRNEKNAANAERLGIFIGLWAPTFMIIGNALQQQESLHGMASQPMESAAGTLEGIADNIRPRADAGR